MDKNSQYYRGKVVDTYTRDGVEKLEIEMDKIVHFNSSKLNFNFNSFSINRSAIERRARYDEKTREIYISRPLLKDIARGLRGIALKKRSSDPLEERAYEMLNDPANQTEDEKIKIEENIETKEKKPAA